MNAKDLNYPSLGVKITDKTINSNSTYQTLGEIMGIPIHDFNGVIEPGLGNNMLSNDEIKKLKYQSNYIKSDIKQQISQTFVYKPLPLNISKNDTRYKELSAFVFNTLSEFKDLTEENKHKLLVNYIELKNKAFFAQNQFGISDEQHKIAMELMAQEQSKSHGRGLS